MTATEKATDLVFRFRKVPPFTSYTGIGVGEAKQCALICVDEFLSFHESLYIMDGSLIYQYWQEVKQEIEKL